MYIGDWLPGSQAAMMDVFTLLAKEYFSQFSPPLPPCGGVVHVPK
jgi:hypothetical protein